MAPHVPELRELRILLGVGRSEVQSKISGSTQVHDVPQVSGALLASRRQVQGCVLVDEAYAMLAEGSGRDVIKALETGFLSRKERVHYGYKLFWKVV